MSRNELGKALRTARLAYERETEPTYTITGFGALLRAVEILVERQDKPAEADSGIVAKLEQKIKMQHAEMGEAQARVAELEREQRECVKALSESLLVMPGRTLVEAVKDMIELHGRAAAKIAEHEAHTRSFDELKAELQRSQARECELEKCIAELTAPMAVDGKTPGQIFGSVFFVGGAETWPKTGLETRAQIEAGANAVLRAFGQPRQTPQGAADALRRVRKSFAGYQGECAAVVREAIGAELAKLEAKPVQSPPDTSTESGLPDAVSREKP